MVKRFALLFAALLLVIGSGCGDDSSTPVPATNPDIPEDIAEDGEGQEDVLFPVLDALPGAKDSGVEEPSPLDSGTEEDAGESDGDTESVEADVPPILITEIMADPQVVNDGDGEWIELVNNGSEPVDMKGWTLRDQGAGGHVFEDSFVIEPGSAVVLGSNGDEVTNGGVSVDYVYPYADFILANGADEVILEVNGVEVDGVRYSVDEGWPIEPGKSLSLKPSVESAEGNDDAESWCAAPLVLAGQEPGSPGLPNPECDALPESDCSNGLDDDGDTLSDCEDPDCALVEACSPFQEGSLLISEIMANPAALSDGEGEWFEVMNGSEEALDVRGLVIRSGDSDGHTVAGEEPILVQPGEFLVIEASAGATEVEGYVWGTGFGSLKNSAGAIEIVYGALVVDRVEWSAELGFVIQSGVSLSCEPEQLDASSNDLAFAWCPGVEPMENGDLGSPGAPNPSCPEADPCGNGQVDDGEECDDGNAVPEDGCELDCTLTPSVCGDGTVDEGESCDDGNAVGGDGCSAACTTETSVETGALIVTEIMANPDAVSDSVGEWFEVHNTTDLPLPLGGWEIHDAEGLAFLIPGASALVIEPGGYLVLGISEDPEANGGVPVEVAYGSSLSLSNSSDQIDLVWAGQIVDSFAYDGSTHEIESGISLQLGSQTLTAEGNDAPDSWCSSIAATGEIGTPGEINGDCGLLLGTCGDGETQSWEVCDDGNEVSADGCENDCTNTPIECGNGFPQEGEECDDGNDIAGDGCEFDCTFTPPECGNALLEALEACDDGNDVEGDGCENDCTVTLIQPGQVLISEFMANPIGVADSKGEWLELWNGAAIPVDLEGWTIRDLGSNSHVIEESVVIEPGAWVVLSNGTAEEGETPTVYVYSAFTLGNSSDEIILERPDGTVVDTVEYPGNGISVEGGVSAAREPSTLFVADSVAAEWCSGKLTYGTFGNLGTPGEANLPCSQPDTCGDGVCSLLDGENCWNCGGDCGACTGCDVNLGPGCPGCACEACVCELDASCCTEQWTGDCAALCTLECGGDLCPQTGCGTLSGTNGEAAPCASCVCDLKPECCAVEWDESCAAMCEGACDQDCGAEDGCASSAYPGTENGSCEECVCTQNPSCCEVEWSAECVQLCDLCGGGCLSSGCAPSELAGCNACACKNCVCAEQPFCCDVAWDGACADACAACGQDCGSDGCVESAYPGCDGCPCEATVCEQNPGCCDVAWDFACAVLCAEAGQVCSTEGCEPKAGGAGCSGCLCETCVCDQKPECCDPEGDGWTAECAELCIACGQPCPKDGCSPSAFPGCGDCTCEACVCESDPACCDTAWDEACVLACDSCDGSCGFTCGNGAIEPGELCDNGDGNSDSEADACRTTCVLAACGDGVQDTGEECDDGNTDALDGCSEACLFEGESAGVGDLILTEVLINPIDVVDGLGEWFEFINATDGLIELSGLVVQVGVEGALTEFTLPQATLSAGDVIAVVAASEPELNGGIAGALAFQNGAEIPNSGSPIIRILNGGIVVDEVVFGPLFPSEAGISLSLDPLQFSAVANNSAENWCKGAAVYGTTGNLGTPGSVNPACPSCGDGTCGVDETCSGCPADCGACTTGCVPSTEPGCGGCPCEVAACDLEPSCCSDAWTPDCVAICEFLELCPGE